MKPSDDATSRIEIFVEGTAALLACITPEAMISQSAPFRTMKNNRQLISHGPSERQSRYVMGFQNYT